MWKTEAVFSALLNVQKCGKMFVLTVNRPENIGAISEMMILILCWTWKKRNGSNSICLLLDGAIEDFIL